jgi:general secretion pathway protein G
VLPAFQQFIGPASFQPVRSAIVLVLAREISGHAIKTVFRNLRRQCVVFPPQEPINRKKGRIEEPMSTERKTYGRKKKFSLIWLHVVLAIMSGTWQPKIAIELPKNKEQIARIEIVELGGGLLLFYFDVGRYPTSSEGLEAIAHNPCNLDSWKGLYLTKDLPKDPWGKPYIYRCPGQHDDYDLLSCGADGVEGSDDDVVKWR